MRYCEFCLPTPAENLACDEALLDLSEAGGGGEVLRVWEPADYFVVLGYANRRASEVNLEFCRTHDIPVLRRCSGGGTVLQGPGCLNYALILHIDEPGPRLSIPATNQEVLEKHRAALARLLPFPFQRQGETDLAVGAVKFSGNAQRRKRHFLLFHGSFLLSFDLALMEKALPMPGHQPAYRAHRGHAEFLMNLPVAPWELKRALREAWAANEPMTEIPGENVARLVQANRQESWISKS